MKGFTLAITLIMLAAIPVAASSYSDVDSTTSPKQHTVCDKGLIGKIKDYLANSNKPKQAKKIDFSIFGVPHYSPETKFGLGLVAAGQYRQDLSDTTTTASDASIFCDVTTAGYYKFGISGHHFFPHDTWRIEYSAFLENQCDKFWGIGHACCDNPDNETSYTRQQSRLQTSLTRRMAPNLYLGPQLQLEYVNGRNIASRQELWQDMAMHTFTNGIGIVAIYDTRDNATNAYRGAFLKLDHMVYPRLTGNKYAFSKTELTVCHYRSIWAGCILAMRFHARLTYGNTPWGLMSKMGGCSNMRGYQEGRYNDKCLTDATIELRQHIWKRNGAVIWIGAGEVFPKISKINIRNILPNYGIGYRWEFKKRVNVCLDIGFGKHQSGFMFNINEAF